VRWIAVPLVVAGWLAIVFWLSAWISEPSDLQVADAGGQVEQALGGAEPQPAPQAHPAAPTHAPPPSLAERKALAWEAVLEKKPLTPISTRYALGPPPPLVAAEVVDGTVRYVLRTDSPAWFLSNRGSMSGFLYNFRFGEKGRNMVVRLLGGRGRLAWAAGHDGAGNTWVRVRPDLAGCGPIEYAKGRWLRPEAHSADAPPCPASRKLRTRPSVASSATVLR
jgi:hypothetical protein